MTLDLDKLRAQLRLEEGDVRHPYKDPAGNLTCGVGHNLDAQPLSDAVVDLLLTEDINDAMADLDQALPWWRDLDEVRGRVLIDLTFNVGIGSLLTFQTTLLHIEHHEFDAAASRLLQSKWASQVGHRAQRLALMMRTGQDPL